MAQTLDTKAVLKEAREEIRAEKLKAAKKKFKEKLGQIENAKVVLANLERELDELEHEISAGL